MGDSRETPTSYWKYKQEFSDLQNTHKNLKLSCEENLLMYNITHLAAFFNCFLCTCRKIEKTEKSVSYTHLTLPTIYSV